MMYIIDNFTCDVCTLGSELHWTPLCVKVGNRGLGNTLNNISQFWIMFKFLWVSLPVLGLHDLNVVIMAGVTSYLL